MRTQTQQHPCCLLSQEKKGGWEGGREENESFLRGVVKFVSLLHKTCHDAADVVVGVFATSS